MLNKAQWHNAGICDVGDLTAGRNRVTYLTQKAVHEEQPFFTQ
jgi:hypothetical protein